MAVGCWKVERKLDNGRAFKPGYVQLGCYANGHCESVQFGRTDQPVEGEVRHVVENRRRKDVACGSVCVGGTGCDRHAEYSEDLWGKLFAVLSCNWASLDFMCLPSVVSS
jgi:hypothetical protein